MKARKVFGLRLPSPRTVGLITAVSIFLCVTGVRAGADEPVRGLVVDRTDNILWLGLPGPAGAGAIFDVMLIPGDKVIARAEVVESTQDAPYVAKAKFVMEDPDAFIPIGAYVEAAGEAIAGDRDKAPGFKEVGLGPPGINPLSFSAGVLLPVDSDLRDETDDALPAFQLSYTIDRTEQVATSLSVGYYHGDGRFTVDSDQGTRDLRVLPVTLDWKLFGSDRCTGGYLLLSVGVYDVRDERTVGAVTEEYEVSTFGWQAGVGYESKSGRFAQAKWVDVSKSDFRGIVFSLGARF